MNKITVAKKMLSRKDTIDGDYSKHLGPEDKFSEKDETKEKKMRKEKNGRMPKANWEV